MGMREIEIKKQVLLLIQALAQQKGAIVVAIDGRCASGKSQFGDWLRRAIEGNLISMDDFFLRPEQRTKERYTTPGENVDHERFLTEVLRPLQKREAFAYRPFDCSSMDIGAAVEVKPSAVTIIEGTYAMRKEFQPYYDYKIFMTVHPEKQMLRIQHRNPAKVQDFKERWIPYEEKYFTTFAVEKDCDIIIDTTDLF